MNLKEYEWPTNLPQKRNLKLNGTHIELLEQKYGALAQSSESLYSRICVVNSCISLEPFRGCPLDCVYCAANNDIRSINLCGKNIKIKEPELIFHTVDLLKALIIHPAFIKNKSVISFCSGSTEVFHPNVEDDVWEAMKLMTEIGLKNPIWLVVKSFFSKKRDLWKKRFKYLINYGITIILSISDAGLPREYEPYQVENRFTVFKDFGEVGVKLSHHLRPLFNYKDIYNGIDQALRNSQNIVSSICIGGIRYDPGMEYYWKGKISNCYEAGNQKKDLPENIIDYVRERTKCKIPVFQYSSRMLSYYLSIEDFGLHFSQNENLSFIERILELKKYGLDMTSICRISNDTLAILDITWANFNLSNGKLILEGSLNIPETNAFLQAIGLLCIQNNLKSG